MTNLAPPKSGTTYRTYQANVHPGEHRETIERFLAASNEAMADLSTKLRQMIAVRVDATWLDAWASAHSRLPQPIADHATASARKPDRADDPVFLACLIAASWVGVEPRTTAGPGQLAGRDEAVRVVSDHLNELRPGIDPASFLADAAILRCDTRDETVWVSYLSEGAVPSAAWSGLDARLTGSLSKPSSGDVSQQVSGLWSLGCGTGEKSDPSAVLARAVALRDGAADLANVTVSDLARALTGEPSDGASIVIWAREGFTGKVMLPVRGLLGDQPGTAVLGDGETKSSLRSRIVKAMTTTAGVWRVRASDEASGAQKAGPWLLPAITAHMPGVDGWNDLRKSLLIDAAAVVAIHRAKLYERAEEVSDAARNLTSVLSIAEPSALKLVDDWTVEHVAEVDRTIPSIPIRDGLRGWRDVVAAMIASLDANPKATLAHLVESAEAAGGDWRIWWEFVAANRALWRDGADVLDRVLDVHRARKKVAGLKIPAFTRPHPTHAPKPAWFGSNRPRGALSASGAATIDVWDGVGRSKLTVRWSSDRIRDALHLGHDRQAGRPLLVRDDPTARLAAGVGLDRGSVAVNVDVDPLSSSFSIGAVRDDPGTLRLSVSVKHTIPAPDLAPERTVLGVHLGLGDRDATWALWRTIPAVTAPQEADVVEVVVGDRTRRARRVGKQGQPVEFAYQVRTGTIRLAGPDRWADDAEKTLVGQILTLVGQNDRDSKSRRDLKIRRSQLVASVHRKIGHALDAQAALARLASGGSDARDQPTLDRLWPLVAESVPLAVAWKSRMAQVAEAVGLARSLVFARHALGVSPVHVAEVDNQISLVWRLHTAATPGRADRPRKLTEEVGAQLITKRNALRQAWTDEVASRIVKTAIGHSVDIIAFADEPSARPSAERFTSTVNKTLARRAHKSIVDRVTVTAALHGIRVTDTQMSRANTYRRADDGSPLISVRATTLRRALEWCGDGTSAHPAAAWWTRAQVKARRVTGLTAAGEVSARSRRTVAAPERSDDMVAASRHGAELLLAVAAKLDDLALEQGARDAKAQRDWLAQFGNVVVHLPWPSGAHVAPANAQYLGRSVAGSEGMDAATLRLSGLDDKETAAAHSIARKGLRRYLENKARTPQAT